MKNLTLILMLFYIQKSPARSIHNCKTINDDRLLIHVAIRVPQKYIQEIWMTAKSFNISNYADLPLDSIISKIASEANYCPGLASGGYDKKVWECLADSAVHYLERNQINRSVLLASLTSDVKKEFLLDSGTYIDLSIIRIKGSFWVANLEEDNFGENSLEMLFKKKWFREKTVYIPFEVSVDTGVKIDESRISVR